MIQRFDEINESSDPRLRDQSSIVGRPPSLLRRMRISTRMYASITSLLALCLLAVLIACIGLLNLKSNVGRYAEADRFATLIDRIDRDIVELQRDVLIFSFNGNPSAPQRVVHLGNLLRTEIIHAQSLDHDEDTDYRLVEMRKRLESYLEKFPEVVAERNTRRKLEVRLRDLEQTIRPAFDGLREIVEIEAPAENTEYALIVERSVSYVALAQIHALRFFSDPDVAHVRKTTALLDDATTSLKELYRSKNDRIVVQAQNVVFSLLQYESQFLRAVQATRGYLSLVNVVMAGDAAEFLYQSKQIQERAAHKTQRIASDTLLIASRSAFGAGLFAVVALVASLVITTLAVRGIVNPIAAMTTTFSKLMQGQNDATIPGLELRDEIGDMARAAEMFRSRNQQTEELLQQSRQLAAELDSKANELARSNADLNSFAYVASHDLRSPLRAIDNIATWLDEDVGDSISDESRSLLGELRRRVRRMEQLLSELLEYSRAGREEARLCETNLHELISETVRMLELPDDAEIVLEEPMPTIIAERGSLTRVFLNLLSNAIKYRSDEPLQVRCACRLEGDHVLVTVSDNGMGIDPKFHDRIFLMFKRLHSQSQIEGSGMGLALVQKLVEQAGGEISVESEEHKGACFRFSWPADEDTSRPPGTQSETRTASSP